MELGGGPVKTSVRQFKCIFGEGQVAINELFNDCKKAMDGMIHSNHGTNLLNQPIEPTYRTNQVPDTIKKYIHMYICMWGCVDKIFLSRTVHIQRNLLFWVITCILHVNEPDWKTSTSEPIITKSRNIEDICMRNVPKKFGGKIWTSWCAWVLWMHWQFCMHLYGNALWHWPLEWVDQWSSIIVKSKVMEGMGTDDDHKSLEKEIWPLGMCTVACIVLWCEMCLT